MADPALHPTVDDALFSAFSTPFGFAASARRPLIRLDRLPDLPEGEHLPPLPSLQQLQECVSELVFGDLPPPSKGTEDSSSSSSSSSSNGNNSDEAFLSLFSLAQLVAEQLLAKQEHLLAVSESVSE
jgi:hypothetical protein